MTQAELEHAFEQCLSQVTDKAAESYIAGSQAMVARVNAALEKNPDLPRLIGDNNVESMRENHAYHAQFVGSLLRTRSITTLVDTITWFYRKTTSRGFHPDYWPVQMEAWKAAVKDQLGSLSPFVLDFYELLESYHKDFLQLSKATAYETHPDLEAMDLYNEYLEALLKPSGPNALVSAQRTIKNVNDVEYWWLKIIEPAMHEIGRLWAVGTITVAQEHIASGITSRVMSSFYPMILAQPRGKGNVIMTASPGELHEIPVRMVSDLLEIHGFDVYYLGANAPAESICRLLNSTQARVLGISTTLPSNLGQTERLIAAVRADEGCRNTHVIVGGQAYTKATDLWKDIGADAFAANGQEALDHLEQYARES